MSQKIHIEDVEIEGNRRSQATLFDTVLQASYKARDLKSLATALGNALDELRALDVFEKVEFYLDDSVTNTSNLGGVSQPALLKIKIEEKSPLVLQAGTFVESKSSAAGFETKLGVRNPLGNGEKLSFEGAYGRDKSNKFSLNFEKPRFYGFTPTLNVLVNKETTNFLDSSSYEEISTNAEVRVTTSGNTSLSYHLNHRDIIPKLASTVRPIFSDAKDISGVLQYDCSSEILAQARPRLKSCIRINNKQILGNTRLRTQLEYSGIGLGGDTDFFKGFFETQSFQNLETFNSHAIFTFRTGALLPFRQSKAHISDRFFLGGPLNLRGFHFRGAGPHSKHINTPQAASIGGEYMWSAGLTFASQLPLETLDSVGLQAVCYLNAGNLINHSDSFRSLLLNVRSSCGIGLVLPFQAGRIELTYSYILSSQALDSTTRLQLGVGVDFL